MNMVALSQKIPWWAKLGIKLLVSRLPFDYSIWRRLSIFRHGFMTNPEYAYEVFTRHFEAVDLPQGFSSVELGPGDSLFSAIISQALGGSCSYLVDTGRYAVQAMEPYYEMQSFLQEKGLPVPDLEACSNLDQLLNSVSAQYLTNGLASLSEIPSESIDYIWSNAVLEHIRRGEFSDVMKELRRILKPTGICSHEIDLRDHLGGALNNLRFAPNFWEKEWVSHSGFYTNRIRYSEMLEIFSQVGFSVESAVTQKWERIPTSKDKMAPEFRCFADEDLCVSVFSVTLKPV